MSVDELRDGLARLASTVVPDEDPYGTLLAHARRRRRNRFAGFGALVAGALVTALLGPPALGFGGPGDWFDDTDGWTGYPVASDGFWRLVDSPTRGGLAGDRKLVNELTRVFDTDRDEISMTAALPEVKVLFADESTGSRLVVVAYYSEDSAAMVVQEGRPGDPPETLVGSRNGSGKLPPEPFALLGGAGFDGAHRWTLALAPDGCTVSHATPGTVTVDGSIRRVWRPAQAGDHVLVEEQPVHGWWRVECDGKILHQGPAGRPVAETGGLQTVMPPRYAATPSDAPTIPRDAVRPVQAAAGAYRTLTEISGLPAPPDPVVRWIGTLPGGRPDEAVVVAPGSGTGPVVLHTGSNIKSMVALAKPGEAPADETETQAARRADWSLTSTAVATSPDFVAVRIPERAGGHAVLTDKLLVLTSPDVAEVEMVMSSGHRFRTSEISGGVAVLTVPVGDPVTFRRIDAAGQVIGTDVPWREPASGERLFGESLVSDW